MDWSKWKKLFSHISVEEIVPALLVLCLLYTSDAADE